MKEHLYKYYVTVLKINNYLCNNKYHVKQLI